MENHQTAQTKISAAIGELDDNDRTLHAEALEEGYKDEVCPKTDCEIVLLAHKHFLLCNP